jgi:uncharacterized phage protein (TIGR02220 family)
MDKNPIRPSFLIYKSFYKPIKNLSNEDKGKLFSAIFEYQTQNFDALEQVIEPQIEMAFEFFKNQFELDNKKWEKRVEAQRSNGKKGGRPKNSVEDDAPDEKTNKTQETSGFLNNLTKPIKGVKEKVKEKVKEIVKEKDKSEKSICNKRETATQQVVSFILDDLNKRLSLERGFKGAVENTKQIIQSRMSEGYSKEDFITVNQKKVKQWLDDPGMSKFLRPETLYGNKFEGYLNEVTINQVNTIKQKPKYQTADERRIENNRQTFNLALEETENGTKFNA